MRTLKNHPCTRDRCTGKMKLKLLESQTCMLITRVESSYAAPRRHGTLAELWYGSSAAAAHAERRLAASGGCLAAGNTVLLAACGVAWPAGRMQPPSHQAAAWQLWTPSKQLHGSWNVRSMSAAAAQCSGCAVRSRSAQPSQSCAVRVSVNVREHRTRTGTRTHAG